MQHFPAIPDQKIASIHESIKAATHAVGISDVLKHPQAVQHFVPGAVIVRQDLSIRKSEAGQEALIVRIGSLPFLLRLGVDCLRRIHGPGADPQDHAVEAAQ